MHLSELVRQVGASARGRLRASHQAASLTAAFHRQRSGGWLIDLLADAKILIQGGTVEILVDEVALGAMEDARLGPRLPRRGRPVSD